MHFTMTPTALSNHNGVHCFAVAPDDEYLVDDLVDNLGARKQRADARSMSTAKSGLKFTAHNRNSSN
jgi:hypothetical protein